MAGKLDQQVMVRLDAKTRRRIEAIRKQLVRDLGEATPVSEAAVVRMALTLGLSALEERER